MKDDFQIYTETEIAMSKAFAASIGAQVVVVMVETSHPANIGSAARAMKTMGLHQMRLVKPYDFPSARAFWLASGATDLLESAQIFATFEEALADCQLVIGTSARLRTLPWPNLSPDQTAEQVIQYAQSGQKVALVFGREARGLTNDELRACQVHTMIPGHHEYAVLNIAQAVQVLCYQLRMSFLKQWQAGDGQDRQAQTSQIHSFSPSNELRDEPLANQSQINGLLSHFQEALEAVEFIQPHNHGKIWPRLLRMFQRARLDEKEVALLRGLSTQLLSLSTKPEQNSKNV